jgi:hypothetical protein
MAGMLGQQEERQPAEHRPVVRLDLGGHRRQVRPGGQRLSAGVAERGDQGGSGIGVGSRGLALDRRPPPAGIVPPRLPEAGGGLRRDRLVEDTCQQRHRGQPARPGDRRDTGPENLREGPGVHHGPGSARPWEPGEQRLHQDQGVRRPAPVGQVTAESPDPDGIQDAEARVERSDDPGCEPRGFPCREPQRQLGQVPVGQPTRVSSPKHADRSFGACVWRLDVMAATKRE